VRAVVSVFFPDSASVFLRDRPRVLFRDTGGTSSFCSRPILDLVVFRGGKIISLIIVGCFVSRHFCCGWESRRRRRRRRAAVVVVVVVVVKRMVVAYSKSCTTLRRRSWGWGWRK
jgi:hypothetical protein